MSKCKKSRRVKSTRDESSLIMQQPRRTSRAGCIVCKRRKIKCGEEKPNCLNCIKHSAACNYNSSPHSSPSSAASCSIPESGIEDSGTNLSILTAVSLNRANVNQMPNFSLFDLEMLHTYSNLTHLSVSYKPAKRALWRTKVPKIGFSYPFVMRALLSLSALQLRHLTSDKERRDVYSRYAERLYQMALQEAAGQLCNVTAGNCAALLLFEIIYIMYAFAAREDCPMEPKTAPEATTDFSWIANLRGVNTIFFSSFKSLRSGPLAPMLSGGDDREQQWQQPEKHPYLDDLRKAVAAATDDSYDATVYKCAITELEKSFN
ncbi:hypothetical protein IFR05_013793, partial [Cadophora sp. M221]